MLLDGVLPAFEPVEPPPERGLLTLHGERGDIGNLLRESPQNAPVFFRKGHFDLDV